MAYRDRKEYTLRRINEIAAYLAVPKSLVVEALSKEVGKSVEDVSALLFHDTGRIELRFSLARLINRYHDHPNQRATFYQQNRDIFEIQSEEVSVTRSYNKQEVIGAVHVVARLLGVDTSKVEHAIAKEAKKPYIVLQNMMLGRSEPDQSIAEVLEKLLYDTAYFKKFEEKYQFVIPPVVLESEKKAAIEVQVEKIPSIEEMVVSLSKRYDVSVINLMTVVAKKQEITSKGKLPKREEERLGAAILAMYRDETNTFYEENKDDFSKTVSPKDNPRTPKKVMALKDYMQELTHRYESPSENNLLSALSHTLQRSIDELTAALEGKGSVQTRVQLCGALESYYTDTKLSEKFLQNNKGLLRQAIPTRIDSLTSEGSSNFVNNEKELVPQVIHFISTPTTNELQNNSLLESVTESISKKSIVSPSSLLTDALIDVASKLKSSLDSTKQAFASVVKISADSLEKLIQGLEPQRETEMLALVNFYRTNSLDLRELKKTYRALLRPEKRNSSQVTIEQTCKKRNDQGIEDNYTSFGFDERIHPPSIDREYRQALREAYGQMVKTSTVPVSLLRTDRYQKNEIARILLQIILEDHHLRYCDFFSPKISGDKDPARRQAIITASLDATNNLALEAELSSESRYQSKVNGEFREKLRSEGKIIPPPKQLSVAEEKANELKLQERKKKQFSIENIVTANQRAFLFTHGLGPYITDEFKDCATLFLDAADPRRDRTAKISADQIQKMLWASIGEHRNLLPSEIRNLVERNRMGDEDAGNEVASHHGKWVLTIARDFQDKGLSLSDLVAEGFDGLDRAIDTYHSEKGAFTTHSERHIYQKITRALSNTGTMIRIPVGTYEKWRKVKKYNTLLSKELGRSPTMLELAQKMNMKEEKVKELLGYQRDATSMNVTINERGVEMGEFIHSEYANPIKESETLALQDSISDALAHLTTREAEVIQFRFGLHGGEPMTLEEIGEKYHVTRERIRQLEAKALGRLRNYHGKTLQSFVRLEVE